MGVVASTIGAIAAAIPALIESFWSPPEQENSTVRQLEEHIEEEKRKKYEEECRQREQEEEKKMQAREAEAQRREKEARSREENANRREQEAIRKEQEAIRKEQEAIRKEREASKREEELCKKVRDAEEKQREERAGLQQQIQEQKWRAEEHEKRLSRENAALQQQSEEQKRQIEIQQQKARQQQMQEHEKKVREEKAALQQQMQKHEEKVREEKTALKQQMQEHKKMLREEKAALQRQAEIQQQEANEEKAALQRQAEEQKRQAEIQQQEANEEKAALEREIEAVHGYLEKGIQPLVWPTEEEFQAAKARTQYNPEFLHLAVSGKSGSGKSSLINALRGLKKDEQKAAKVGIVETTLTITRYPDPRTEAPYPRFIWYDVPGAGTFKTPTWQYFNQQGLFIFDFIVLVYDIRFDEIDADILVQCQRFDIPAFIVRSKSNQHITNMMNDDDTLTYTDARAQFIQSTREDLRSNLENYGLANEATPRCYIISKDSMYDLVLGLGGKTGEYIDEAQLLHDLLKVAYKRRYGAKKQYPSNPIRRGVATATAAATAAFSMLSSRGNSA